MSSRLSKLAIITGTVITVAASAAMSANGGLVTQWGGAKFSPIRVGLTQDDVRGLVGSPASVRNNERPGITMWTYNYTDTFGYNTEFDVSFDANGKVTSTDNLRPKF